MSLQGSDLSVSGAEQSFIFDERGVEVSLDADETTRLLPDESGVGRCSLDMSSAISPIMISATAVSPTIVGAAIAAPGVSYTTFIASAADHFSKVHEFLKDGGRVPGLQFENERVVFCGHEFEGIDFPPSAQTRSVGSRGEILGLLLVAVATLLMIGIIIFGFVYSALHGLHSCFFTEN